MTSQPSMLHEQNHVLHLSLYKTAVG